MDRDLKTSGTIPDSTDSLNKFMRGMESGLLAIEIIKIVLDIRVSFVPIKIRKCLFYLHGIQPGEKKTENRTLLGGKCQVLLLRKRSSVKCLLEVYVCFRIFKTELFIRFFVGESVASQWDSSMAPFVTVVQALTVDYRKNLSVNI